MSAYAALERRFTRLDALEGASGVLSWDQAVMMPKGGTTARGEQLATLAGLAHEILTAAETGDLIERAAGEDLSDWQHANLREIRRLYARAIAVPSDLVEELNRRTTACEMVWRDARSTADFARLAPHLDGVLGIVRESAAATAEALGLDAYDALIDGFQPGIDQAAIDPLFAQLEDVLPGMIDDALVRHGEGPPPPEGPFPVERQRLLMRGLTGRLGFDFEHGRLDESTHPFCGGVPSDVRITTRYDENEIVGAVMAVLHETGHALYEMGLPRAWRHQPVGNARGMALHESQSLVVEMQACRSPAFLRFLAGELARTFTGSRFDADDLVRHYTKVERGFIRVDADELTYPLHIVLRYRLEKALIAGDLTIPDLPAAWNEGMMKLLGIRPPDDREGCLQDIHWPLGGFGYFPAYTLGALLAAQLFERAKAEITGLDEALAAGEFAPLRNWLGHAIHEHGSRFETSELIGRATGGPLSVGPFLAHLKRRYLA